MRVKSLQKSVTTQKTTIAKKFLIAAPWALHLVSVHGIERRSIFVDAQDWWNFLERSGHIFKDFLK
jgi:hypothetical protein